jgi:hypothetical protein
MSKYGSLANWDGSRSLSLKQHSMDAKPSFQEGTSPRRENSESDTWVASTMLPPPLLPPQADPCHIDGPNRTRSRSTGQLSTSSSYLESEDERSRVASMLLELDEEHSVSPTKACIETIILRSRDANLICSLHITGKYQSACYRPLVAGAGIIYHHLRFE